MIRLLFIAYSIISPLISSGGYMSLDDARKLADRFYANIEKAVNTGKEPGTDEYLAIYGSVDGKPRYAIVNEYPNYLFMIDMNEEREPRGYPETVFGEIVDFRHQYSNIIFSRTYINSDLCKAPELIKNEEEAKFFWFHFRTEWTVNGKKTVIDDTLYVNREQKYISRICNRIIPLKESSEETLEDMLAKATALYNNKKYNETVALYSKILNKYPGNNDAWYYLGVMYFKNQGIEKMSKKQRLKKAYDCWKKSDLKKARRAISYITDGRE